MLDTSDALISVNRNAFLHNIEIIGPSIARYPAGNCMFNVILNFEHISYLALVFLLLTLSRLVNPGWDIKNCFLLSNRLVIIGGGEIQSMEETTQGNSAAMAIYALRKK